MRTFPHPRLSNHLMSAPLLLLMLLLSSCGESDNSGVKQNPQITSRAAVTPSDTSFYQSSDDGGSPANTDSDTHPNAEVIALPIYDDALRSGFQNWSWAENDLSSTEQISRGGAAISVDMSAWGGLYFSLPEPYTLQPDGSLRFSIYAQDSGAINVQMIGSSGDGGTAVSINPTQQVWNEIVIPVEDLTSNAEMSGLWWQDATGSPRQRMYIDDVRITAGDDSTDTGNAIQLTVSQQPNVIERIVVNPASGESQPYSIAFPKPINDDIYGLNFATNGLREELGVTVNRWGGNGTERYNHLVASSNTGHDWFYANSPGDLNDDHDFENSNQTDGAKTILTIPMLGWVAANRDATCSYPSPDAQTHDASIDHWIDYSVKCGNGKLNGEFVGVSDPNLTSIPTDEQFAATWVQDLVATHGTASDGGVELYALGNEPGLWHATHGDIQANPMSRAQIIERNIRYAKAIKQVDGTASVIGPVLWSGSSYYVSSDEMLSGQRPGDVPLFLDEYLQSMSQAHTDAGFRLMDKLAVNFYDDRVYQGGSDKLRLESTRQLWDPDYAPSDWWVTRDFLYGNGSMVVPRLKSMVEQHYPDTPVAITEYHFGGPETVAGALTQMDALGIFGREGLDMATLWEPYGNQSSLSEPDFNNRPIFWAFRMFRNYDGNGGRFGNESVYAMSGDESSVSVFAANRSSDNATTVLLINKTMEKQLVALRGIVGNANVFRYSSENPTGINQDGDIVLQTSNDIELSARSALLLVVEN